MNKTHGFVCVVLVMAFAVAVALTGCDSADGVSGIQVSPSSVTLSGTSNNTVVFSVQAKSDLALPLVWGVADGSLGSINYSSGSNAIYIASSKKGNQVVSVKDQYNNEGFASVVQQ